MPTDFPKLDYPSLDRLAAEHGDAFYLFTPAVVQSNLRAFRDAFTVYWPRSRIAYSYKTNYMPSLCRLLQHRGCRAEVVSGMEYQLAKAIGAKGAEIFFNGPYKRGDEIEEALRDGAVVNVDSPYEIELIRHAASRFPNQALRVGVRAAFLVDGQGTRFGLDIDNGDFDRAVEQLSAISNVNIVGFHTHMVPPGRTTEGYRTMTRVLIDLYRRYADRLTLEFLDLGGGFFSNMPPEMGNQFSNNVPTFEDYGRAIAGTMRESFGDDGPELILEPGMALVADVMQFASRVVDIKAACGKSFGLVAGSVYNVKPSKSPRNLPIRRVAGPNTPGEFDAIDLVGYTCMEDDIIHRDYAGPLATGDFVLFQNVGSYTLPLKPPFIQPNAPVLSISGDGGVTVVKRGEQLDDLLRTYVN